MWKRKVMALTNRDRAARNAKLNRIRNSSKRSFEQLEDRRLLAVTATVVGDDLRLSGVSEGPVAIVATGASTFTVSENGVVVATLEGVTDDIYINLDAGGEATNDDISLQLEGATIDRIVANVGDGDNSVKLQSGSISGSLSVVSGNGDDALDISAGTSIARSVYARLGDGDNSFQLGGSVAQSLLYDGGIDDDTVTLLAESLVSRFVGVSLGDGVNQVALNGKISESAIIGGGNGDDSVSVGEDGLISGSLLANLGSGSNSGQISGEITGDLRVKSKTAADKVTVEPDAIVGGTTSIQLGVPEHNHKHRRGPGRGR